MSPADVLAVEIKQYVGEGRQTLVPRMIGQTAEAQARKGRPESRRWDEQSLLEEIERRGPDELEVARQIIEWSRSHLPRFAWGKGTTYGSLTPTLDHGGHSYFPFYMGTDGRINIQFQWMSAMPPFDQVAMREEFLRRLNEVPGVQLPSDAIDRRPGAQDSCRSGSSGGSLRRLRVVLERGSDGTSAPMRRPRRCDRRVSTERPGEVRHTPIPTEEPH